MTQRCKPFKSRCGGKVVVVDVEDVTGPDDDILAEVAKIGVVFVLYKSVEKSPGFDDKSGCPHSY